MAEYISKKDILQMIESTAMWNRSFSVLYEDIEDMKPANVSPVRHGRWVSVPHKLVRVCSVCNRDEPYKFADIDADVYDYCPNCGARMNEEVNT